jgi:hypothetical protein
MVMPCWYAVGLVAMGVVVSILCAAFSLTAARAVTVRVSWFSTAFAVLYKMIWSQFDVHARTTEPYWQLTMGHAPLSSLFVDYAGLPTIVLPLAAIRHGHWHLFFVGFCSILAELLVICMSSVSDMNSTQWLLSSQSSTTIFHFSLTLFWTVLVMGILIPFIMSVCVLLVWKQRRRTWLPKAPGKLASLLLYMHSTKLVHSMEKMLRVTSRREQQRTLEREGKTYALDWFQRADGGMRIAIDEEPKMAKYELSYRQRDSPRGIP